jgi:hypothetical protein
MDAKESGCVLATFWGKFVHPTIVEEMRRTGVDVTQTRAEMDKDEAKERMEGEEEKKEEEEEEEEDFAAPLFHGIDRCVETSLFAPPLNPSPYCEEDATMNFILLTSQQCPASYTNDPRGSKYTVNATIQERRRQGDDTELVLVACEAISPGSEIFVDYGYCIHDSIDCQTLFLSRGKFTSPSSMCGSQPYCYSFVVSDGADINEVQSLRDIIDTTACGDFFQQHARVVRVEHTGKTKQMILLQWEEGWMEPLQTWISRSQLVRVRRTIVERFEKDSGRSGQQKKSIPGRTVIAAAGAASPSVSAFDTSRPLLLAPHRVSPLSVAPTPSPQFRMSELSIEAGTYSVKEGYTFRLLDHARPKFSELQSLEDLIDSTACGDFFQQHAQITGEYGKLAGIKSIRWYRLLWTTDAMQPQQTDISRTQLLRVRRSIVVEYDKRQQETLRSESSSMRDVQAPVHPGILTQPLQAHPADAFATLMRPSVPTSTTLLPSGVTDTTTASSRSQLKRGCKRGRGGEQIHLAARDALTGSIDTSTGMHEGAMLSLPLHSRSIWLSHGWNITECTRQSRSVATAWLSLATSEKVRLWEKKRRKYWQYDCSLPFDCSTLDDLRVRLLSSTEQLARDTLHSACIDSSPSALRCSGIKLLRARPGEGLQDIHFDVPQWDMAVRCYTVLLYLTPTMSTAFPMLPINNLRDTFREGESQPSPAALKKLTRDQFYTCRVSQGDIAAMRCIVPHFGVNNPDSVDRYVLFLLFSPAVESPLDTEEQRYPLGVRD